MTCSMTKAKTTLSGVLLSLAVGLTAGQFGGGGDGGGASAKVCPITSAMKNFDLSKVG